MSARQRQRVAAHEAAHALAAVFQGVAVHAVELDPDGGGGRTIYENPDGPAHAELLFLALAGREGENALCGPSGHGTATHRDDYSAAWDHATHYSRDPSDAAAVMAGVRADAVTFVRRNTDLIAALANELSLRGHMHGADLSAWLDCRLPTATPTAAMNYGRVADEGVAWRGYAPAVQPA